MHQRSTTSMITTERYSSSGPIGQHGGYSMAQPQQQHFPNIKFTEDEVRRGAVKVLARSPYGVVSEMGVIERGGTYTANFTPNEPGTWIVSILFEDQHIQGSPFNVKVYDPGQVKVTGIKGGVVGVVGKTVEFSVETPGPDGALTVDVSHNNRSIPPRIIKEHNNKYHVSFIPEGSGLYIVTIFYAGEEVTGSPFTMEIIDISSITVSTESLALSELNRKSNFVIHTEYGVSSNDLDVYITGPSGTVPHRMWNDGNYDERVEFVPTEPGEYRISVAFQGRQIVGSPFTFNVFDNSRVSVLNLPQTSAVNKQVDFDIDLTQSGNGHLQIMVNNGDVHCPLQQVGSRLFHASFVPREPIPHYVQIKLNERDVPGSPWRVDAQRPTQNISVFGNGLQMGSVGQPASFEIRGVSYDSDLRVNVIAPSRRVTRCNLSTVRNGVFTAEYIPMEVGQHVIEVMCDDSHVPGSPFTSKVYDAGAIVVNQMSPAVVGSPVELNIDVSQAGEGNLEIVVNNGLLQNNVRMINKGLCSVTFVPRDPRPHTVDIKFNGDLIPDGTITIAVIDPSAGSRTMSRSEAFQESVVNRQAFFPVPSYQPERIGDLTVHVTSPNGDLVPAKMVQQPDGDFKVEYSSRYTGRHRVEILYEGQTIMGSPFFVEIYDPNKIIVEGTRNGSVGQRMEFSIRGRQQAGKAEMKIAIKSPRGQEVPYDITQVVGADHVTYIPTEPGVYHIFITYGGLEVPGCPVRQEVFDNYMPTVYGEGLTKAFEDQVAIFYVDAQGLRGDLVVQVDGPNSIAKCNIEAEMSGRYKVEYVPVEVGTFTITIKWNGREIDNSPFHPKVVNQRKVMMLGDLESTIDADNRMRLHLNETKVMEFDTRSAGAGILTAEVKGPNGMIPVEVIAHEHHKYTVSFTPRVEGEYLIKVMWNGEVVPGFPLIGSTLNYAGSGHHRHHSGNQIMESMHYQKTMTNRGGSSGAFEKVVLTGMGLRLARVNTPAQFNIDGSQAPPGKPSVRLTGDDGEIVVHCVQTGEHMYKCTYTPTVKGTYYLSIMWGDAQVNAGTPYEVTVLPVFDSTSDNKVTVVKSNLQRGVMGRDIRTVIDTSHAQPGELKAQCMGPTRPAICLLDDHKDGTFTLRVRPQEVGAHSLTVKYAGEHIDGSPFSIFVSNPPDASKIYVSGPGLKSGSLNNFESWFKVHTEGAGEGELRVNVRGPGEGFKMKMQRQHFKDRTILCSYNPTEPGDYTITIRWSDQEIRGSPFLVSLFDGDYPDQRESRSSHHQQRLHSNEASHSFAY